MRGDFRGPNKRKSDGHLFFLCRVPIQVQAWRHVSLSGRLSDMVKNPKKPKTPLLEHHAVCARCLYLENKGAEEEKTLNLMPAKGHFSCSGDKQDRG